jgi:hypothetical protein
MSGPNKMEYSKLLGFDIVADELKEGVDFKNSALATKLGAKVGAQTITKTEEPMVMPLQSDVAGPGAPVMQGLGGRKVGGN